MPSCAVIVHTPRVWFLFGRGLCEAREPGLSGWWRQDTGKTGRVVPVAELDATQWHVAVYVSRASLLGAFVRDKFLESMGRQTRARCEVHELPLVVSMAGVASAVCCA